MNDQVSRGIEPYNDPEFRELVAEFYDIHHDHDIDPVVFDMGEDVVMENFELFKTALAGLWVQFITGKPIAYRRTSTGPKVRGERFRQLLQFIEEKYQARRRLEGHSG